MNYLSIDYGTRKSGLAINIQNIAIPFKIVETKDLLKDVKQIILEKKIEKIIIGIAYHIDGRDSITGEKTKTFAKVLKKHINSDIEIIFEDERLTSFEAENSLIFAGVIKKHIGKIDDMAASIILQSYIDRNKGS